MPVHIDIPSQLSNRSQTMTFEKLPYSFQIGTGSQSRETDRQTIEDFGIDGFTLMETAGLQAAGLIANHFPGRSNGLFVCGKGNNAGDALVVARYLSIHHRHRCHIVFVSGVNELSPDAEKNYQLLKKLSGQTNEIHFLSAIGELGKKDLSGFDYVVDGLLGTGLTTDLRTPFDQAVKLINRLNCTVYTMDIPTGLHADKGIPMPEAVRANHTLSFGIRKLGFYLGSGPEYTGQIHPFDLSFPAHLREYTCSLLSPESDSYLPTIHRKARHKYADRVVYIIAGSEGLTGAAIMASRSSWSSGAGAVILITPKGLLNIYEQTLPEIIKAPVGYDSDFHFKSGHLESVTEILSQKQGVLLIGPGLGRNPDTIAFTKQLLTSFKGTVLIDADALYALEDSGKPEESDWVLTPHPGEAAALRGKPFTDDYERINWSAEFSIQKGITLVSKGSPTFIGTKSGENYLTGYDTQIFSRAGFGDILAGSISAYIAITNDPSWSSARALLDGYRKATEIEKRTGKPLKPIDLL